LYSSLWPLRATVLQRGFLFGLTLPRVEPLLDDDSEIGEYIKSVSRQQLSIHVPAAKIDAQE
jgi:hypothetical protein